MQNSKSFTSTRLKVSYFIDNGLYLVKTQYLVFFNLRQTGIIILSGPGRFDNLYFKSFKNLLKDNILIKRLLDKN